MLGGGKTGGLRVVGLTAAAMLLVYAAALIAIRLMGYQFAVVMSDSMRPAATRGDLVLSRSADKLRNGDVVLFRRGNTQVVHRLLERTEAGWRTKGDANPGRDPWVLLPAEVDGKAVGVLRGFGLPLMWVIGASPSVAAQATSGLTARAGFSTSSNAAGLISAKHWTTPSMTWTIYANASSISATSTTLSITGSGERRAYSATRYSGDSRIHIEAKLTASDATKPGYAALFNGCISTGDAASCGWYVFVDSATKKVTLQTIVTNLARSSVLASCNLPSSFSFGSTQTISFQHVGKVISVIVNGAPCLKVLDAPALAAQYAAKLPNGNFTGIMASGSNALQASKVSIY